MPMLKRKLSSAHTNGKVLGYYSVFDVFKIGIGPSSSHTNAPMLAANKFSHNIVSNASIRNRVERIGVDLYGSLALTGFGHGTFRAIAQGLKGERPASVPCVENYLNAQHESAEIVLNARKAHRIQFVPDRDIACHRAFMPGVHPNFMRFNTYDKNGILLACQEFSSVGGGELNEGDFKFDGSAEEISKLKETKKEPLPKIPYSFKSAAEILNHVKRDRLRISELVMANEKAIWSAGEEDIDARIQEIVQCMYESIERGCHSKQEFLPGSLKLRRRAPKMFLKVKDMDDLEKVSVYAIAVNEENAAGGRVVTAPSNGSAGVIPALMYHYCKHEFSALKEFLLTASAIGSLYKLNASVSAAQVGCQGEIGVSSSMAAAGLTSILLQKNAPEKVFQAAETAMEHHLGLTCDPVGGLVQIPCIERNAIGAVKAIAASKLALLSENAPLVSLDTCIKVMYETGLKIDPKLRETSLGGLAEAVKKQIEQKAKEEK